MACPGERCQPDDTVERRQGFLASSQAGLSNTEIEPGFWLVWIDPQRMTKLPDGGRQFAALSGKNAQPIDRLEIRWVDLQNSSIELDRPIATAVTLGSKGASEQNIRPFDLLPWQHG